MAEQHVTQKYNFEAERDVIYGCLAEDEWAWRAFLIIPDHRYFRANTKHRDLARVIESLITTGKPVNYTHIVTELNQTGKADLVDFVNQLISEAPLITLPEVLAAAERVKESHIKYWVEYAATGEKLQAVLNANGNIETALADYINHLEQTREFIREQQGDTRLPNAADLLTQNLPETAWAIPDLLPAGLTILGGKPKLGKSWLALQISLAICSGGKFFGRNVEQGRVLYLALEDGPKRLQKRMKAQGWSPLSAKNLDYLFLREFMQKIGPLHEKGNTILASLIERNKYRMVAIDTIGRSVPGLKSQNEYQAVSDAFGPIQEVAISHDCSLLGADHHTKLANGRGLTPDAVADVQGSIGKGGVADAVWGLYKSRTKAEALLQIDGRDIEQIMSLAIKFDHATATWQIEGDYYQKKQSETREEILNILAAEGPSTLTQISQLVGRKKPNVYHDLKVLVAERLINKDSKKMYYLT